MFNFLKRNKPPKFYDIYQVDWVCTFTYTKLGDSFESKNIIRRRVQVTDYDSMGEEHGFYYGDLHDLLRTKVDSPLTIHQTHLVIKGYVETPGYSGVTLKQEWYNVERSSLYKWKVEYTFVPTKLGQTDDKKFFKSLNPLEKV